MTTNIALIIIFNHRFDKNIEILDRIYRGRFTHIHYIVPFYEGTRPDVIPVYGNSYYYSVYIAQAFRWFFKAEYTHYLFIADDLILNPALNETNLLENLGVQGSDCFIPEIVSLHNVRDGWHTDTAMTLDINRAGINATGEIPTYEEAVSAFNLKELVLKPLTSKQAHKPESLKDKAKRFANILLGKEKRRSDYYELPYPQVAAFSDILLVSGQVIKKFSHYCGVFGSLKLFVELAIPTSLVFSADKIRVEKDLQLQGKYLWTEKDYRVLEKYDKDLERLMADFPANHMFIHPVKLSKWKTS